LNFFRVLPLLPNKKQKQMGNANNKMSRSCVPGANNNSDNKAQTGTMDERIDARRLGFCLMI
jgi:hypothetical protein